MINSKSVITAKAFQMELRWPAAVAVVATAMLYLSLPERLTAGPNWLLLALMCTLLGAAMAAHYTGNAELSFQVGLLLSSVMTAALIWSLGAL
jgi:hypothetical protein